MSKKFITRRSFLQDTAFIAGGAWASAAGFVKLLPSAFSEIIAEDDVIYFKTGDSQYDVLRKGFNLRIDKKPAVIALCKNTNGVVAAVKYAVENKLPIAVKSGGHCMEGFSCNNGGMVINLSLLNSLSWKDASTVTAGPAATLKSLYEFCLPKGKVFPGGSCQSVALGGLALGGGYGLLSRQLGLTCDSLTGIKMVDGNGNIITSDNDSELLWACKGGANGNFGIITEMNFKTHKAPAVMQSFRLRYRNIPDEKIIPLMETWFEVAPTLPKHCFSALIVKKGVVYILVTTTEKSTASLDAQLTKLKSVTTTAEHSVPRPLARALKAYYAEANPIYFKNASAGLYKNFADIKIAMPEIIRLLKENPRIMLQINTLGGEVQNPVYIPLSSFPYRDHNFFSELQAYYDLPSQADQLLVAFESIQHIFEKNGISAHYRNYPDVNFKNPLQKYYGASLGRLHKIKNKYDPLNNIRHEQSIT